MNIPNQQIEKNIIDFLNDNPGADAEDITSYLKIRTDKVMIAIAYLREDNKIIKDEFSPTKHGYFINEEFANTGLYVTLLKKQR